MSLMTTNLTYVGEAASSKTLEALAQVIRALAPEVRAVSFHDFAADTLWLSEDFILPEDHQLVEDSLSSDTGGNLDATYGVNEGGKYSMAIPVRDANGAVNGAVRLSIDAEVVDTRTSEPLEQRLAPVFVCLAAEFERRQGIPLAAAGGQRGRRCRSNWRCMRSASNCSCSPFVRCRQRPA